MTSPHGSRRRASRSAVPATLPYASPSLEVLENLTIENGIDALDSRLDSMEIDVARLTGMREDDVRRTAGELAVMKARVDDALQAFAATADEIRGAVKATQREIEATESARVSDRAELHEVTAQLTRGMDALSARMEDMCESMLRIRETLGTLVLVPKRIAEIEEAVARLEAGSSALAPAAPAE